MPLISVIMPVFNVARYLSQAVDSVLCQTFSDFEFIAVDDGSTDRSLAILKRYADQDRRIRVISRANTGIAGAINDGLAIATGSLLARIDGDDVSPPGRFEMQVKYLQEHPECVLLGGRVMLTDPYGVPQYEAGHKLTHEQIEEGLLQGQGWAVFQSASMMRMEAVRAVGGYRRQWDGIEDLDIFLRLMEIGRAANLPDVLLYYRQHLRSTNHTRAAEQQQKKLGLLTEMFARRGMGIPSGWALKQAKPISPCDEIQMWGWVAIRQGRLPVARRHAMSLLKRAPLSGKAWRLAYCAVRGR